MGSGKPRGFRERHAAFRKGINSDSHTRRRKRATGQCPLSVSVQRDSFDYVNLCSANDSRRSTVTMKSSMQRMSTSASAERKAVSVSATAFSLIEKQGDAYSRGDGVPDGNKVRNGCRHGGLGR